MLKKCFQLAIDYYCDVSQDEPNGKVKPEGESLSDLTLLGLGAGGEINSKAKTESAQKHITNVFSGR